MLERLSAATIRAIFRRNRPSSFPSERLSDMIQAPSQQQEHLQIAQKARESYDVERTRAHWLTSEYVWNQYVFSCKGSVASTDVELVSFECNRHQRGAPLLQRRVVDPLFPWNAVRERIAQHADVQVGVREPRHCLAHVGHRARHDLGVEVVGGRAKN